jgi:hypothetical protein
MSTIASLFGSLSGLCFAVQPIRQIWRRREFSQFKNVNSDARLGDAVEQFLLRDSISWNRTDSISTLLGAALLLAAFVTDALST